MKKKGRQSNFKKKEEKFDSDDERAYKDLPQPDKYSSVYDEIDDFHKKKLKKKKQRFKEEEGASSNDEVEVLSLSSEDDYEDQLMALQTQSHLEDVASDIEEDAKEEGALPNDQAWGSRKKSFYHTDYVDDDLPGLSDEEEEQAEEEKEALAIQQRMAEALDEDDFSIDLYKTHLNDKGADVDTHIVRDLSKLSKKEKLQHLEENSPELIPLIEEFKSMMNELIDTIHPLLVMVEEGKLSEKLAAYVTTKFNLYTNYCINVGFYLALKSKQVVIKDHPILTRILSFKNLIKELKTVDSQLQADIKRHLVNTKQEQRSKEDKTKDQIKRLAKNVNNEKQISNNIPKKKLKRSLTEEENAALEYYKVFEEKLLQRRAERENVSELEPVDVVEEEDDTNEKREITYQMSKNKGLTVRKKKEQRIPRVKHRMKFRRAKIRRKGQVRESRTETKRYSGEAFGIRAGVIKSVQIK